MPPLKNLWITAFGEAIEQFPHDYEKQRSYALAIIYTQNFMVFEKKDVSMKKMIIEALRENKPIKYYIPQCMRYYYDENGELQIIGSIDDFKYIGGNGEQYIKYSSEFTNSINKKLEIPFILKLFGLPLDIELVVMDNELLRYRDKYNEENISKIIAFTKELSDRLSVSDITVSSSLQVFGNPIVEGFCPHIGTSIDEMINILISMGITKKTIQVSAGNSYTRYNRDNSRNTYYRSIEFAYIQEIFGLFEAYFHGLKMVRNSQENSGILIEIPHGADDIMTVLKKIDNICPFSKRGV